MPFIHRRRGVDRRTMLRLSALGLGALGLGPVAARAAAGECAATSNVLIVINADGGLRSAEFCDAYEDQPGVMDLPYAFSEAELIAGDWYLPPAAASLLPYKNDLAIIRDIDMESNAHPTGQRLAMTGINRTSAPAGPVLAAACGACPTCSVESGLSFDRSLQAGTLLGPVAGEATVLGGLFAAIDYASNAAYNSTVTGAIAADDARFVAGTRPQSPMRDWQTLSSLGRDLQAAGIDPTPAQADVDRYVNASGVVPWRFAAAYRALELQLSNVITITVPGFDTHTSSTQQGTLCLGLANSIAQLIVDLTSLGILSQTTLFVTTDFDRTPALNGSGGTDHSRHGSVFLMGNGIAPGVHNNANGRGQFPGEVELVDPYTRKDVWATVLSAMGVEQAETLMRGARLIPGVLTP